MNDDLFVREPAPHVPVKGTLVMNQIQWQAERMAKSWEAPVVITIEAWTFKHDPSLDFPEYENEITINLSSVGTGVNKKFADLIELNNYVEKVLKGGNAQ